MGGGRPEHVRAVKGAHGHLHAPLLKLWYVLDVLSCGDGATAKKTAGNALPRGAVRALVWSLPRVPDLWRHRLDRLLRLKHVAYVAHDATRQSDASLMRLTPAGILAARKLPPLDDLLRTHRIPATGADFFAALRASGGFGAFSPYRECLDAVVRRAPSPDAFKRAVLDENDVDGVADVVEDEDDESEAADLATVSGG